MKASGRVRWIVAALFTLALSPCALARSMSIANIEELYGAVNDPGNAGATLVLAPGTYIIGPGSGPGPMGMIDPEVAHSRGVLALTRCRVPAEGGPPAA